MTKKKQKQQHRQIMNDNNFVIKFTFRMAAAHEPRP